MARKPTPPAARALHAPIAPPDDLRAEHVALWHELFSAAPRGFYAPADVPAMRLMVELAWRYRELADIVDRALAAGREPARSTAMTLGQVTAHVQAQMGHLRMHPSNRMHRNVAARMASDPGLVAAAAIGDWRATMRQAQQQANVVALPSTKRRSNPTRR